MGSSILFRQPARVSTRTFGVGDFWRLPQTIERAEPDRDNVFAALYSLLFLPRWVQVWSGIDIDRRAVIGPGLYVGHFGGVIVAPWATMGSNVTIQHGVTIGVSDRANRPGGPVIGDRAYIGAGAKVIGKITIGNDGAIGANAVVNADAPDRAVVVGVAAKVANYEGSFDIVLYAGMDTDPARLASLANTPRAGSL